MDKSVAWLKEQLQNHGISTSTPGLVGGDRHEELLRRYEVYSSSSQKQKLQQGNWKDEVIDNAGYVDSAGPDMGIFKNLPISEIKSRLNALGESTSTPGLAGEERRSELLNRLIRCVCGGENEEVEEPKEDPEREPEEPFNDMPSIIYKRDDSPPPQRKIPPPPPKQRAPPTDEPPVEEEEGNHIQDDKPEKHILSAAEVSELKKSLKRLQNRRAIAIAARLSGDTQDRDLALMEKSLGKAEAELNRLKSARSASNNTMVSSVIVDGGAMMSMDRLLKRLEAMRTDFKEQVRQRRAAIRDEECSNESYGESAEEALALRIRDANYDTGKKIRDASSNSNNSNSSTSNGDGDRVGGGGAKIGSKSRAKSGISWELAESTIERQKQDYEELMETMSLEAEMERLRTEPVIPSDLQSNRKPTAAGETSTDDCDDEVGESRGQSLHMFQNNDKEELNKPIAVPPREFAVETGKRPHRTRSGRSVGFQEGADSSPNENNLEPKRTTDSMADSKNEPLQTEQSASFLSPFLNEELMSSTSLKMNSPEMKTEDNVPQQGENLQETTSIDLPDTVVVENDDGNSEESSDNDTSDEEEFAAEDRKEGNSRSLPFEQSIRTTTEESVPPLVTVPPTSVPSSSSPTQQGTQAAPKLVSTKSQSKLLRDDIEDLTREPTHLNDDHENIDSDDADSEDDETQIKALRAHTKVLLDLGDVKGAEALLERALELDPLDVRTLRAFAVFLHQKRGELARAEAFFYRALQVCMPTLFNVLKSSSSKLPGIVGKLSGDSPNTAADSRHHTISSVLHVPTSDKGMIETSSVSSESEAPPAPSGKGVRIQAVLLLLLHFARFLTRAKGDVERATIVYKKAVELAPYDAAILAAVAHFLGEEGSCESDVKEALDLFARSLRADPENAQHALWYAKLLRKTGNHAQAEVMYRTAVQRSLLDPHVEPTAMCNYAIFLYRERRCPREAKMLFELALEKYPKHKGLRKNFAAFSKSVSRRLARKASKEATHDDLGES